MGKKSSRVNGASPGRPPVEVAAVVLHPAAHPRLGQHLEVVLGAHAQPLGLEQLAGALQLAQPLAQLGLDAEHGPAHALVAGAVVGVGEHDQLLEVVADLAGHHVEGPDPLDGVAEELDPDGAALVGGVDLHGVAVARNWPRARVTSLREYWSSTRRLSRARWSCSSPGWRATIRSRYSSGEPSP